MLETGILALCLVVGVSDGDTLTVRCGQPGAYEPHRVRIAAIDAPEKGQPFGARSKDELSNLCFMKTARVKQVGIDGRWGRSVATVECNGIDAGQHQVEYGYAWVYRKYAKGFGHLFAIERNARDQGRGLWADPEPTPPWDFRIHNK